MSWSYNLPTTRKLTDHYMTIGDLSPTEEPVPIDNSTPSTEYNPSNNLYTDWYENVSTTSAPVLAQPDQSNFFQAHTNTSNDYSSSSTSTPFIENFSTEYPIASQPRPSISSESTSKRSSSPSKSDSSTLDDDDDDIPVDTSKKKDKKKLAFLHSSKKSKSEKKKAQTSEEVSFDDASLCSFSF